METKTLTTTLDDGVLIITFNRPEKMNAWSYQVHTELNHTVEAANLNKEVDAIVLTGNGKGFCAGADMSAVFGLTEEQKLQARAESKVNDWVQLVRCSKPMIAAVNGTAVGIGITLILPMDQIIAADNAKFILAFVKMGIVPELGGSGLIQRRVGFGAASRVMLTGDPLTAQEALDIALVDRVVSADTLLAEATALARRMGRNPHAALREIKQLLTENASEIDLDLVQQRERDALSRCYVSAEHKEAVAAFMAKRAPDFKSLR
jgi:enoyl-CoA hydratase/carnithine racemase